MLRSPHDRDIARLAVPALGALAIDPLVSLVDTAFVTQLGEVPLGALGVSTGLFGLAFFVFNFLAYGTTPLVADAIGRGDRAAAGRVVGQSLTLAVLLGVLGMLVLELAADPLVRAMGATDTLHADAVTYLRARAWATPAVLLITAGNGAYRGVEDTMTPLWFAAALNVVNLVLDPILIFGLGWGLAGAAVASAIAQWVGAALFLVGLLGWHSERFQVPRRIPGLAELVPLMKVGGILSVRTFALVGTLTAATAVATRVGTAAVGAHQVAWQLWGFAALIVDALAVAGQALVARYVGAGRTAVAREVGDRLLLLGMAVGILLAIGLAALGPILPLALSKTPAAAAELQRIWWIVVIMQPLNAAIFVWDGIYLGARRFRFVALSMVGAAIVGCAVLGLVLPLGWGLVGVWGALVALNLARGIGLAGGYLRWGRDTPS